VAGASTAVPTNTCYVRATGVSTVNTLFLRAADPSRTSASTSATATARIAPTSPPAHTNGTWPITRWKNYPGRGTCAYVPDSTCVFWSNNGGSQDTSIGSWKEKVYLSKYSQFTCSGTAALQLLTPDPSRLGNPCASSSVKQLDMEGWLRNGFFGSLSDGKDGTPASRPEVDTSGVQGNNYADAMRDYIDANPESCSLGGVGGRCRVLQVILWEQAEKYVNGTWQPWPPSTSNPPDRIIISDIFCFKFYRNQINSSSVSGIYLSCYESTPPLSGPPSGVANTVQMVD
jgi:hypothetical protein